MSAIEESIEDLIDTAEGFGRGIVSAKNVELAQLLINSLIAAALADARREGAEQMRDAAAKLTRKEPLYYSSGEPAEEELAQAIEDLPLPTGERQAVPLTDEEIQQARSAAVDNAPDDVLMGRVTWLGYAELHELSRSIEAAALEKNGMEVRRG